MDAHPASIRTPDQRIRVFLSSTLRELEPEREAARAAIESLRLAPVMFELGARPHPPRSLYRAYLAQSDIFIGLYWQSYGWVAPDEEISGLEDEYRLSGGMPHLIYIKHPAPERDARLDELLTSIKRDDHSSYRGFSTPEELAELIVSDVATLLADRFDASRAPSAAPAPESALAIPAAYTSIVGRSGERDRLIEMIRTPGVRIVTIVGPGGIGKSRLAIEVAETIAATGREVAFAILESVTSPDRVISVIARAVGVRETGDEKLETQARDGAVRSRHAAGRRQHGAPARCDGRPGEPDHPAAAPAAARHEPLPAAGARGAHVRAGPARGARCRRFADGCRGLERRRPLRRAGDGDQRPRST